MKVLQVLNLLGKHNYNHMAKCSSACSGRSETISPPAALSLLIAFTSFRFRVCGLSLVQAEHQQPKQPTRPFILPLLVHLLSKDTYTDSANTDNGLHQMTGQ